MLFKAMKMRLILNAIGTLLFTRAANNRRAGVKKQILII